MDAKKAQMANTLYQDKSNSIKQICETLKISRSTLYKYLEPRKPKAKEPETLTISLEQLSQNWDDEVHILHSCPSLRWRKLWQESRGF